MTADEIKRITDDSDLTTEQRQFIVHLPCGHNTDMVVIAPIKKSPAAADKDDLEETFKQAVERAEKGYVDACPKCGVGGFQQPPKSPLSEPQLAR